MGTYDPVPATGSTGWDTWNNHAIQDLDSRLTSVAGIQMSGVGGFVNLDSFAGADDTAKLKAFLSYSAAQTFKPIGRLSNRQYNWNGPITMPDGMALAGPFMEREYSATSTFWNNEVNCRVSTTSTGSSFWTYGTPGVKSYTGSIYIQGIHFDGGGQSHDFMPQYTVNPCPILSLSTFRDCGYTNYRTVFFTNAQAIEIVGFHFQNSLQGHVFLQGADSRFGHGDHNFVDHGGINYPSLRFGMDATIVEGLYLTPSQAGCAVQFDRGTGTQFNNNNFDSAAQQGTTGMCNGSLIQLRGGTTIWTNTRLFGAMYNAAAANGGTTYNKGYVTATGGSHVYVAGSFENGTSRSSTDYTPANTPHIYATSGVAKVAVAGLIAPGTEDLRLVQQTAGKFITSMDPYITIG